MGSEWIPRRRGKWRVLGVLTGIAVGIAALVAVSYLVSHNSQPELGTVGALESPRAMSDVNRSNEDSIRQEPRETLPPVRETLPPVNDASDVGNGAPSEALPESAAVNQKPVVLDSSPAPAVLAWELSKQDYEAILENPDATEHEKREAGRRHRLRFYEWPGRGDPYLAGFGFKLSDYRLLRDYEESGGRQRVLLTPVPDFPPAVWIEHFLVLTSPAAKIAIDIAVFSSREFAQRHFLGKLGGWQAPEPPLIGDVWSRYADQRGWQAGLSFVRHNVFVSLETYREGPLDAGELINLEELAFQMDRKIIADAIHARTWADMADHRPRIERFELDRTTVMPLQGKTAAKVILKALPPHDIDESVSVYLHGESPTQLRSATDPDTWVGVSLDRRVPRITEERECRVWAIAYLPNLLFTVAETTILVKPAPDDD